MQASAHGGRWGPVEHELISKAAWAVALAPTRVRSWRMRQGAKELLLFVGCLAVAAAIIAGSAARL